MPIPSLDSDLDFALKDAGVPVLYGTQASHGTFGESDVLEGTDGGGVIQIRMTTLLIRTGALVDLRRDGRIVVNGVPYVIRGFDAESDGHQTRIRLARSDS